MKIVSFYTIGTEYEQMAAELKTNLSAYGFSYDIVGLPSQETWQQNCAMKPLFLLKKLKQYNMPLLWIDVDAVVLKPFVIDFHCDIALRINESLDWTHASKVMTGTIYLRPSEECFTLLESWNTNTQNALKVESDVWDQITLRDTLIKSKAKVQALDKSYCTIYEELFGLKEREKPHIMHFQASRALKKVINREISPFIPMNQWKQTQLEFMKTIEELFS